MMTVSVIALTVHDAANLVDDARYAWQRKVFKMVRRRQGNMWRRDADDGSVEIPERLVRDDRGNLRAPSAKPGILLNREQATGLGDRTKDRLGVEWHQTAHIDYFRVDAMLTFEDLRGFERAGNHQGQCDDRAIAAGAENLGGSQCVDDLAVGDL